MKDKQKTVIVRVLETTRQRTKVKAAKKSIPMMEAFERLSKLEVPDKA
jgi:hypothetical protein